MDEEQREQVVALLTRIGMMAEDLSTIALGAAGKSHEELGGLVEETMCRIMPMKVLGEEANEVCYYDQRKTRLYDIRCQARS